MHIASSQQTVEELLANAMEAIAFLRAKFPGGFENIRSLYLKLGSLSLPIYIDTGEDWSLFLYIGVHFWDRPCFLLGANFVYPFAESPNAVPVQKAPVTNGFAAPAQEITTLDSARVKVCRDGSIKVLKQMRKKAKKV